MWILFWKLALQLLAVVIAILVNVLDYVSSDKRTKKFRRRRQLLFALSGLFLIASVIVVIADELAKREEMAELSNRLNLLQQQGEIAKHLVTGGDSYCYLNAFGTANYRDLILIHQGDFPLYDLQIRVVDLDKFDEITKANPNPSREQLSKAEYVHYLGTLNPNQAHIIGNLRLPTDKDEKGYNVFILARNGEFSEPLRFHRANGMWLQAFRVEKSGENPPKTLIEKIDDGFPRNEKGNIDW
ncbi:MAG: hypothetical protein JOZ96_26090 [Acidobacteria bacterium]|nr:hypothetical protein [Acidobacteriota bacterium]